jgi:hypothetical protein
MNTLSVCRREPKCSFARNGVVVTLEMKDSSLFLYASTRVRVFYWFKIARREIYGVRKLNATPKAIVHAKRPRATLHVVLVPSQDSASIASAPSTYGTQREFKVNTDQSGLRIENFHFDAVRFSLVCHVYRNRYDLFFVPWDEFASDKQLVLFAPKDEDEKCRRSYSVAQWEEKRGFKPGQPFFPGDTRIAHGVSAQRMCVGLVPSDIDMRKMKRVSNTSNISNNMVYDCTQACWLNPFELMNAKTDSKIESLASLWEVSSWTAP